MANSDTHVRVEKNGIQDTLPKTTWNAIGGSDNKDGWILIQDTPPEAVVIRQKKEAATEVKEEAPEIVEVKKEAEPVKVKDKVAKKGK